MKSHRILALCLSVLSLVALALGVPSMVEALQAPPTPGRFSGLVIPDPSAEVSPEVVPLAAARVSASIQSGWASFKDREGPDWDVYLDARSGAPILVQGQGIPLVPGGGNALASTQPVTLDSLASLLRGFVAKNASLLLADDKELALDAEGSGQITPDLWQVVFAHHVAGVPVAGDRYVFYVGHGNLIAFGASRWSPVAAGAAARISRQEAFAFLSNHLRLDDGDQVDVYDLGTLVYVPTAAAGTGLDSFDGAVGTGYQAVLAWRIALYVDGEPGALEGLVDAHSGAILSVRDLAQYARVKGGVFPVSDDGICPGGCEQGSVPMPSANISIGTNNQTAGSMGLFSCTPGGSTAVTTLAGPYIRVADSCGAVSISTTCDSDLDLGTSEGTDCGVPVGSSPGNTHAARTSFYHLNRIKEHVRAWLPSNAWIDQRLTTNVNINNTCNAYWSGGASGTVNFYRSGGGCRNTGEISSILLHEWGHGLDDNDGGGMDNPSEAYSDITAFMVNHASCMSRGFSDTNCGGYGNACLSCTGIRDSDWNQRTNHAPQTPENWPSSCPVGTGPCHKEVHCEAALAAETLWDLTVRDLPAAGIDQPTAWQIVDRLWFKSRQGSGGDAYTCGSPASNRSCAATSWFTKLRTIDDDDGNLANGTPHAAQIFSAFSRHNIPCGASTDAANRNTSSCPSLVAPTVATTPGFGQVALSWTAVPNAAAYNVLRNDQGCNWGYTIVATVSGTTYTDTNLPDYYPVYYAIQPVGSNSACVGPLSACTMAQAGGPRASYAGSARVADSCSAGGAGANDGIYDAGELIQFSVTIRNDGVVQLTGVTATVTPTTAGVTMVAGTAGYPNLAVGATGSSTSPHFKAQLPPTLACGSPINYNLTINADQGSWSGSFSQTVGQPLTTGGTVLSESFSGGIPVAWEVSDGGDGGGAAATWTTANPGGKGLHSAPCRAGRDRRQQRRRLFCDAGRAADHAGPQSVRRVQRDPRLR